MLAHPQQQDRGAPYYAQIFIHNRIIEFAYVESIVDRFLLLLDFEKNKMPWLEGQTGIDAKRWHGVKQRKVMRTSELDAVLKIYPNYAYWLTTGKEIPEAGQISPMTKRARNK